jgi:hypothetical protein
MTELATDRASQRQLKTHAAVIEFLRGQLRALESGQLLGLEYALKDQVEASPTGNLLGPVAFRDLSITAVRLMPEEIED